MATATKHQAMRVDTAQKVRTVTAGVIALIDAFGRVRRNPLKPRGNDRHAWQHGYTLQEMFRFATEAHHYTGVMRKTAEQMFVKVYNERLARKLQMADGFVYASTVQAIDDSEFDTREIKRALLDMERRLNHYLHEKGA